MSIKKPARTGPLQRLVLEVYADPEQVLSLSLDEVREELRRQGLDAGPLTERVERLLNGRPAGEGEEDPGRAGLILPALVGWWTGLAWLLGGTWKRSAAAVAAPLLAGASLLGQGLFQSRPEPDARPPLAGALRAEGPAPRPASESSRDAVTGPAHEARASDAGADLAQAGSAVGAAGGGLVVRPARFGERSPAFVTPFVPVSYSSPPPGGATEGAPEKGPRPEPRSVEVIVLTAASPAASIPGKLGAEADSGPVIRTAAPACRGVPDGPLPQAPCCLAAGVAAVLADPETFLILLSDHAEYGSSGQATYAGAAPPRLAAASHAPFKLGIPVGHAGLASAAPAPGWPPHRGMIPSNR